MKMAMTMKTTYRASLSSLSDAWPGSIDAKDFRLFTTLRIFMVTKLWGHTCYNCLLSKHDASSNVLFEIPGNNPLLHHSHRYIGSDQNFQCTPA